MDNVQIFDFFAGPGFDVEGHPRSPAITCEEMREAMVKNSSSYRDGAKEWG